jgi:unsaturated chondroitin disaccharide hydrolase
MMELYPAGQLAPQLESALEFAQKQVRALVDRDPGFYPMYTKEGRWRHGGEAWTHWCDGFLPGMMWIFAARTGDASWKQLAERYSRPLEPRRHDRTVHDLGFIFMSTYYRWHQLAGDPELVRVLIEAGRTLALRFQSSGGYLSSFLGPESLFIDIMMNVGIIFYAAERTNDRGLEEMARRHSLTSRRVLVRGDGSTAHEGIFDPATGNFLRQSTRQGKRADTCWSRGLAWALYGFGTAYSYTRDARFLHTAEACADFYIHHTPAGGVPLWDYDAGPEDPQYPDSSAAAIAASALLQLADLSADRVRSLLYRNVALHTLRILAAPPYLASGCPGWEGILRRGVYHLHKGLGVDESVMWGEYFFVEALDRALQLLSEPVRI